MSSHADGHGRIDDIEALRAFAILFVLVEHLHFNLVFWPSPILSHLELYFGPSTGVDLFFAISGYVITRSLSEMRAAPSKSKFWRLTFAFWIRRAWRLLPSAWLWLAIPLALTVFCNRSGAFGALNTNLQAAFAAFFDFANFRVAALYGVAPIGVSFQYWSLSLEEQFYLLLPLAIFVFRERLAWPLLLIALVQFPLPRTELGPLFMQVRTDALMFGSLLALSRQTVLYRLLEPTFLKNGYARALVLALLLLLLISLEAKGRAIIVCNVGMVAVVSAVLVFIASFGRNYIWPPGLSKRVLTWIGMRSYAMYLIHVPVYSLTREAWSRLYPDRVNFSGWLFIPFIASAAILLIVLSELNFKIVEAPLRRFGARLAQRFVERGAPETAAPTMQTSLT